MSITNFIDIEPPANKDSSKPRLWNQHENLLTNL